MSDEREINLGGRPPHVPTKESRSLVKQASALGVTLKDIARKLRISEPTLNKYYEDELFDGVYEANHNVAGVMYGLATNCPDLNVKYRAGTYWLSRRAGWKEAGKDDQVAAKIQIEVTGGLPDRELKQVDAEGEDSDESSS